MYKPQEIVADSFNTYSAASLRFLGFLRLRSLPARRLLTHGGSTVHESASSFRFCERVTGPVGTGSCGGTWFDSSLDKLDRYSTTRAGLKSNTQGPVDWLLPCRGSLIEDVPEDEDVENEDDVELLRRSDGFFMRRL